MRPPSADAQPPHRSLAWLRALVLVWIGLLAGFAAGIEWIRTRPPAPPPPSGGIDLVGAGATFPYPVYRQWFADYRDRSGVRINYFSVGTGEGIRLLLEGEADFGAADRPLLPEERARATCGPLEVPTVVGAIAVAVNLPRIAAPVRLDPDVLAAIYLGRIRRWDDPALRALNPTLALPADTIHVVQRARTSGTLGAFAAYLQEAPAWRTASGPPTELGVRVEGNEGVAAQVRAIEGSLGFLELSYARQARLAVAALRNRAGRFVLPDTANLRRTAEELLTPAGADTLRALAGARDPAAYPAAAVTRLVADAALRDSVRGAHFLAFARWALRDGARAAEALGYVPLPPAVLRAELARLDALAPGRCPAPGGR